ncbi:MAG: DUF488 domain-containing protein [Thermomicrobiales bacterium]
MEHRGRVYTIGHSNHTPEAFIALLRLHGIATLVDVRSAPYSRFTTQFNKPDLQHLLTQNGIAYRYAGEFLGGRPTDPALYKSGEVPEGKADYLHLVDYPAVARAEYFQRGLARLLEVAAEGPTTMMCSEEDPLQCHRHHLIARALEGHGVQVLHIRKSGETEPFREETVVGVAPSPQQMGLF